MKCGGKFYGSFGLLGGPNMHLLCELEQDHQGPHENVHWEWWGDGPLVRQYGERTSEALRDSAKK